MSAQVAKAQVDRAFEQVRRELATQAREHALLYDADRVLEEHWLPALEEVGRRLDDRLPVRIAPLVA